MKDWQKITLGEKLKNLRRINCLSQEKLAAASGISIRTIQRIEEGKSMGSGYTINALAKSLNINSAELMEMEPESSLSVHDKTSTLKILNLSAFAMLLIPLANVFIPAYIYWKNKDDEEVRTIGGKIVSFHIFWTLATLLASFALPALLMILFSSLRAGSIPLFIPIYIISALCNVCFVILFAINISEEKPILQKIPNIL